MLNEGHTLPSDCSLDSTYVPSQLRNSIVQWVHTSLSLGHPGVDATICLVAKHYWWPSCMFSCPFFAQNKSLTQPPRELLYLLPIRTLFHFCQKQKLPISVRKTEVLAGGASQNILTNKCTMNPDKECPLHHKPHPLCCLFRSKTLSGEKHS